jgi:phosphoglycolate phosphatase-like HAD superfamily hydrolase
MLTPQVREVNGIRIAFVGFTEYLNDLVVPDDCDIGLVYLSDSRFTQSELYGTMKLMIENANITHYFDSIFGIKDNYAREKVSLGKEVVEKLNLNPSECLMIGDTLHDAEVAEQCGFDCILYSGGHVSKQRLETKGRRIIERLSDIKQILPTNLHV